MSPKLEESFSSRLDDCREFEGQIKGWIEASVDLAL